MKTVQELFRQPLKTLTGILLVTIAVAALCICIGQSIAAEETQETLNESFLSIALPSVDYSRAADKWAYAYALEHPEIVKSISSPGLISGYAASLLPLNHTDYLYEYYGYGGWTGTEQWLPDGGTNQYPSAIFEITLTDVADPAVTDSGISVNISGTVENVVALAEGYPDYQGFRINCTLRLPGMEDLEMLELTVGDRYLIYGTDLYDYDCWLRRALVYNSLGAPYFEAFDLEKLTVLDSVNYTVGTAIELDPMNLDAAEYETDAGYTFLLTGWQLDMVHLLQITLEDESAWGSEARHELYREPTIVHLDDSAEDFLASEEGTLWADAQRNIQISGQSFPVIGVNSLMDAADFAQGTADIVGGRSFSEEELRDGAKVCLISQSLAQHNGLSVGDTIAVQFYENDPNVPYQINISEGNGCLNPVPCYYFENTMELEMTQSYTIVGLYRQDFEWDNPAYSFNTFTPNTIFVPQSSVSAQMEYGTGAFFCTIHLHNGTIEAFQNTAAEAGFANMFRYNDNGYSQIAPAFSSYQENAGRALLIGICVYVAMMALFVFLFPCQQRTTLAVMESLGTTRSKQIGHVVNSTMILFGAGTIFGTATGLLLWDRLKTALIQGDASAMDINRNIPALLTISGIQAMVCMIVVTMIALFMTRKRNLMKSK